MTPAEVSKLLAFITELYPGRFTATESTVAVWWEMLKDTDATLAFQAVKAHAASEDWPPAVGRVIQLATLLRPSEVPLLDDGRRAEWERIYSLQEQRAEREREHSKRFEAQWSGSDEPTLRDFTRWLARELAKKLNPRDGRDPESD